MAFEQRQRARLDTEIDIRQGLHALRIPFIDVLESNHFSQPLFGKGGEESSPPARPRIYP
jgi:hypothetical protein